MEESQEFNTLIDNALCMWWQKLADRIKRILNAGKYPVLITLSRKMPRLLDWFRETYVPRHPEVTRNGHDITLLDSCEITTELSIPFRVAEPDALAREVYVLVDDIIIHGTTLRNVANDFVLLAQELNGGELNCYFSTIFLFRKVMNMPQSVSAEDIYDMVPIDLRTTKKVVRYFAEQIRDYSLPIDLEYPVLRVRKSLIPESQRGTLRAAIIDSFRNGNPEMFYEGCNGNTATRLIDVQPNGKGRDFAKIRFFDSEEYFSFEMFAPHILPNFVISDSMGRSLFPNSVYRDVWLMLAGALEKFFREHSEMYLKDNGIFLFQSFGRSCAVWTNYLLSLSMYAGECGSMFPKEIKPHLDIDRKDLVLILGAKATDKVLDPIRSIIKDSQINNSEIEEDREAVVCFAPNDFAEVYENKKKEAVASAECVEQVLSRIFNFQNFSNPEYDVPRYRYMRLFYGETFSSLDAACNPYFKDRMVTINKWIDEQIDNGAVIPKYELYFSRSGIPKWRRFFHAGLNEVQEECTKL